VKVFILSSIVQYYLYNNIGGSFEEAAFFKWIKDLRYDFRVPRSILSNFNFAMFGLGNSEYGEEYYNKVIL
jgi:sulfite reductase alpha subunit-like flavoprotein